MKITRIQRIRDHRIFRNFIWPSELPDFGKFNLIYGWNGSGKTTLSSLLWQLQKKESIAEGEIEFLIDGNTVYGSSLTTATLPQIRVFNRDTVNRIVFESPTHELPPIYVLGEENTDKQRKIEGLKKNLAVATTEQAACNRKKESAEAVHEAYCSDQAQAIKNLLTVAGGGPYNNYNKADYKRTADRLVKVASSIKPLTTQDREKYLTTKDGKPLEKIHPLSIQYPDFASITKQVQTILARSVMSSTLLELLDNPSVATWVNQGLPLHTGENASNKCRFCNQPLTIDRLKNLQGHFNDEFKQFQRDVDDLIATVLSAKIAITNLKLPSKSLLYQHISQEYEKQANTLVMQLGMVEMYLDTLHAALMTKKEEPFKPLELLPFLTNKTLPNEPTKTLEKVFQIVVAGLTAISASLGRGAYEKINALIASHNRHTDNFRQEVVDARKALEEDEITAALADYQSKQKAIADADSNLIAAQNGAKNIQQQIEILEQAIRSHRKSADELNKEMAAYLGRDELRFEIRETGYAISRNGQSAMHLSEGERTAVAFMYFLKSLKGEDFYLKRGIVVIDDPVSSLDANSLYSAFSFMKARMPKPNLFDGQLFVLTHNFTFFRQVKNWFNYVDKLRGGKLDPSKLKHVRFYMLKAPTTNGQRNAQICLLDDLLHEYESEYHYLFRTVYQAASNQTTAPLSDYYGLPNIGRRLLETVLAFKNPEKSGDLYQQLLDVEGFDENKKTRIIRFTHTYSHKGHVDEPEHDLSILSETPAVLGDIMALIEHIDPVHFKGMVSSVAQPLNS